LYVATVAAGEQSGHLDTVLERLADYTESREVLRSKTLNAMLYPVLLFVVCAGIVMLLLTFVVPKIVKQFENSKAELPILTKALIGISDFFRDWGWLVIGLTIFGVWMFRRWLRAPAAKRRFHGFLLRIPLVGKVVRGTNTARFARTLSTLTSSAVPVLEAMRISGEVVTNLPMRDAVQEASARVREGAAIGRSLAATRMFPTDDDPLDLERREQRRSGDNAGPRRHQSGARDGCHPRCIRRPARPAHDPGDGRHGVAHRARDAVADLPAEPTGRVTG
jgi:general secretion pathway protein F